MKHLRMKKSSRMSTIMEKMHLKYSFTENTLSCVCFTCKQSNIENGLCVHWPSSKLKKQTNFLSLIILTLSEIFKLDKGYYPTFMFIHLQYFLFSCSVYVDPGGDSMAEWLGTRINIHRSQVHQSCSDHQLVLFSISL